MGSMSRPAATGLAGHPLAVQRDRVLAAWDAFLAVAERTDLAAPSRLPGWTGHDVCVHVGDWRGVTTLNRLLESARAGDAGAADPARTDAANAAVVAAHRDTPRAEVLAALTRSRRRIADWFDDPDSADGPRALGLRPAASSIGPLPLLTVVAASAYELAVHALDLAPAKAPPPPPALLDAGLAALVDVTGVFAHRRRMRASFAVVSPGGAGWQVRIDEGGWTTAAVDRRPPGAAVEGEVATLLDASAGRRAVPALLAGRQLRLHKVSELVRLAPIVEEVPGLPGGPALRAAARWMGGAGRLLRLGR